MSRSDVVRLALYETGEALKSTRGAIRVLLETFRQNKAESAGLPCLQRAIAELRQAQQRIAAAIDAEGER